MNKKMTISVNESFIKLIKILSDKTGLKKSTIIRIAVEKWSEKNEV